MSKVQTQAFGNTIATVDLRAQRGQVRLSARLMLGDVILHEPHSARHARQLHVFWSARLGAPKGLAAALLWIAAQFEEMRS